MPTHEYFRELSALAEIGEISEKEQAELELHLRSCAECRRAARGYGEVLFEWLPLRSPAEQNTEDELGPSARSRWHLAWAAP
ncbi:MAG: zf-HC2 domain-containing protein, partial [Acidobacteria bacterium]